MSKTDKVILAACVGMLAYYFLKMTNQPLPANNPAVEQVVDGTAGDDGTAPASGKPTDTPEPPVEAGPTIPEEFADLPEASTVSLETDEIVATIDPNKGGIIDVVIKNHESDDNDGPVHLVNGESPYLSILTKDDVKFSPPKVDVAEGKSVTISRAILGEPLILTQKWTLSETSPYGFDYVVTLENSGAARTAPPAMMLDLGALAPLSKVTSFMGAGGIDQRIDVCEIDEEPDWYVNSKIKKFDQDDRKEIAEMPMNWIAVQNKYFALITDQSDTFGGVDMRVVPEKLDVNGEVEQAELIAGSAAMFSDPIAPNGKTTWTYDIYIGPKSWDNLTELGNQKQKLMQLDLFMIFHLDIMEWVSLFIRWMILMVHGMCGNYGIAIICATVVVRMSFWPITHRSTMMSRKMQTLQPLVKELNEKYKDDPQKKSMKMMELYREHNVNLAAGCLPVLLQIPVFFALFNVLRSSIELRHQPFFGWVTDLSAPDTVGELLGFPINPLAAVWGATMILQQRCMPQSADPMQQRMMMIMTGGMLIFMYNMPSGLVLYWTVSNLISILQYRVTRVKKSGEDDKDTPAAGTKQPAAA